MKKTIKKAGSKSFLVAPSPFAACVELCKGDPTVAGLLYIVHTRSNGKTLVDHKGLSGWLAISREQWMVMTGYTRHQLDRSIRVLKNSGLIETQRRKLKFSSPAAFAWIRLAATTKSAIAEIMARPGISAYTENEASSISAEPEISTPEFSDQAEELNEMSINIKNDNNENVIIISETKKTENKFLPKVSKEGAEEVWFNQTIQIIYEGTDAIPDIYSPKNYNALRDLIAAIEKHPSHASSKITGVESLCLVTSKWDDFTAFATDYYKAFNMPSEPQLWAMKMQIKAIIAFSRYGDYLHIVGQLEENHGMKLSGYVGLSTYMGWVKAGTSEEHFAGLISKASKTSVKSENADFKAQKLASLKNLT